MALPSYLDVPIVFQEDDFSCVPACIKMILEFALKQNPIGLVIDISVQEIGESMGTDELGTPLSGVRGINEKLKKTVPSIEFEAKTNCVLKEIETEIQNEKPVVAWLKMPYPHSIVITGVDKKRLIVYYNDPQRGKSQMDMGKFMSSWKNIDSVLIKVKIGEKLQRVIPEFVEKKEKSGEQK
jgi:ABC-type bacteriocin/lantibiotic exporter with double-glycine peptidase domain